MSIERVGGFGILQKNAFQTDVSLVLHAYSALFSDFDPRSFSERMISDDFISECKRAVRDRNNLQQLRLLIPSHLRKPSEEIKIKKRLKEYFRKHYLEKEREIKGIKNEGIKWFFIGSIILTLSTFLYEYKSLAFSWMKFFVDFLFVISQPAGWFTFWEGLGKIFIHSREKLPDYEFYKKMQNVEIYFFNY
jgi:hypothetical protein